MVSGPQPIADQIAHVTTQHVEDCHLYIYPIAAGPRRECRDVKGNDGRRIKWIGITLTQG